MSKEDSSIKQKARQRPQLHLQRGQQTWSEQVKKAHSGCFYSLREKEMHLLVECEEWEERNEKGLCPACFPSNFHL